MIIYKHFVLEI